MQLNPTERRGVLKIAACNSGKKFAQRIIKELNKIAKEEKDGRTYTLHDTEEIVFPNGEVKVVFNEFVRGDDVYIIQCIDDPLSDRSVNDNLLALATATHAAYIADPDHITVVIPQFPYARQERRKTRDS